MPTHEVPLSPRAWWHPNCIRRGMTCQRPRVRLILLFGLAGVAIGLMPVGARSAGAVSEQPSPAPVLWRDPGDVGSRDLFWGAGHPDRAPRPPFTFVKEDTSGTKPKVQVLDGRGMTWSVKFDKGSRRRGREVPAEIASSRILWAVGYLVEESYLVRDGTIVNAVGLQRADDVITANGRFEVARFERRPPEVERLSLRWSVDQNPFVGSQELSGLILLVSLLNNWDFREGNTSVLRVPAGVAFEDRYIISDLGTAFGRMTRNRSRWNLSHFRHDSTFVVRAGDDAVEAHYRPDGKYWMRLPMDHARWFAGLVSRLTDKQLRRAFVAAGASDQEVRGFSARLLVKIRQLQAVTRSGGPPWAKAIPPLSTKASDATRLESDRTGRDGRTGVTSR